MNEDESRGLVHFKFSDLSGALYTTKGRFKVNNLSISFIQLVRLILDSVDCSATIKVTQGANTLATKSLSSMFSNQGSIDSLENLFCKSKNAWEFVYRVSKLCGLRCYVNKESIVIDEAVTTNVSKFEFISGVNCTDVKRSKNLGGFVTKGIELVNIQGGSKRQSVKVPNVPKCKKLDIQGDGVNKVVNVNSLDYDVINVSGVYNESSLRVLAENMFNNIMKHSDVVTLTTYDLRFPTGSDVISVKCDDVIQITLSNKNLSFIMQTGLDVDTLCPEVLPKQYRVTRIVHRFNSDVGYSCTLTTSSLPVA